MLRDFALISALLVLAHLLRWACRPFQTWYIPTPVIAGGLALLGSEQVVAKLRASTGIELPAIPFSDEIGSYPYVLIALLFGTLFLGGRRGRVSFAGMLRRAGDSFFYNLGAEFGQYGVAILFGLLVLLPLFPELPPAFLVLMPAGFAGGHGTAAVFGEVFRSHGWDEAASIGYTFATVGLLSAVFGGMLLVNLGTRLGWTRLVGSPHELPEGMRRGFLAADERQAIGEETVSPMALEPLAWHVSLMLIAFGGAQGVNAAVHALIPGRYDIPLYAVAMLVGALLQRILNSIGLGDSVDRQTMSHLGSFCSDYLVAFGIASIKLSIVAEFAGPLAIMSLLGIAYSAGLLWFVGRRIFHDFWFERSLFVYGWCTGVVAIGVMLLRIVDPRLKSRTLEEYGLAYVFISMCQIALLVSLPPLVAGGALWGPGVVLTGTFLACVALSRWLVGWFPYAADEWRQGEAEAVEEQSPPVARENEESR